MAGLRRTGSGPRAKAAQDPQAAPLDVETFARLMRAFEPFEEKPKLAVAVSGGVDSLCLAVFAKSWAEDRGGAVVALVIDHGLRPESAAEAAATVARLEKLSIPARHLLWRHGEAGSGGNLQAAARAARYRLLEEACRQEGALHLLLAHHLDDQAETLLLRLARGSGVEGLSAMPGESWLEEVRLLRPLLSVPKARLQATLRAAGIAWVEDPSNRSQRFARGRLRALGDFLEGEGVGAARLARTAEHLGRARAALEVEQARLLARAARLDPLGFAWLKVQAFQEAPEEVACRALARLVTTLGGRSQTPRWERLKSLYESLRAGAKAGRTLSGCRFVARGEDFLVVREVAGLPEDVDLARGGVFSWDGRFRLELPPCAGLSLSALGPWPWARVRERWPEVEARAIPAAARESLPALYRGGDLVGLPALDFWPQDLEGRRNCVFLPQRALTDPTFTVAWSGRHITS